jgi:uncharacterized protein (DUF779 family)
MEDLSTLAGSKHTYHITGGEGANHDRNKAKKLVIDDYDKIAGQIDSVIGTEMIYVIFSAGGGTGSGAGPMLIDLILGDKDVAVGAVTVLPERAESVQSNLNAYECIKELTAIEGMASVFFLDNETDDKFMINEAFAEAFDAAMRIPETYTSARGNVDGAELMACLKCGGAAQIYNASTSDVAEVIEMYDSGDIYAETDAKGLKYALYIGDESFNLSELYKVAGTPLDEFRGYDDNACIVLLAGMAYPAERFDSIFEHVSENRDIITGANAGKAYEAKSFDFLEPAPVRATPAKTSKPKSRNDILSKYLNK